MSTYRAECACKATLEVPTAYSALIEQWLKTHEPCLGPPLFFTRTEDRLRGLARDVHALSTRHDDEPRWLKAEATSQAHGSRIDVLHAHTENLISRMAELETLLGLNDENEQECDECHGAGAVHDTNDEYVVCPQCKGRRTLYVPPWSRDAHLNDIIDREFDEEEGRHDR